MFLINLLRNIQIYKFTGFSSCAIKSSLNAMNRQRRITPFVQKRIDFMVMNELKASAFIKIFILKTIRLIKTNLRYFNF